MTEFNINGINVTFCGITDATKREAQNYIDFVKQNICSLAQDRIASITVTACSDGSVELDYTIHGVKFERIRRICGYLTGSLESWNDSKRAEERDRVKHARFD